MSGSQTARSSGPTGAAPGDSACATEPLSASGGKPCGCIDCPFPPCPCGEGHGSCPGGLCRDCYHESILQSIEEHERENPGALEKRLSELAKLFRGKQRKAP